MPENDKPPILSSWGDAYWLVVAALIVTVALFTLLQWMYE
jgi:hypothetical protein